MHAGLIGATSEGKKELVGFPTGVRESAQSWRELLVDIKQRGLEIAPEREIAGLIYWIPQQSAVDCLSVGLNELGGNLVNREVNGDYGGLPTHQEIGFIGQPDLLGAWRSKGRGYDFTRKTLVLGTHMHHSKQSDLEYVLVHDYGRPPPGLPRTAK